MPFKAFLAASVTTGAFDSRTTPITHASTNKFVSASTSMFEPAMATGVFLTVLFAPVVWNATAPSVTDAPSVVPRVMTSLAGSMKISMPLRKRH